MKKVLVVDDTKNIRLLLTTCLELNGFQVVSTNNGKEAIQLFKTIPLDLAFLDIKLPEISGTEVLRKIRDLDINTPVVIMTAFATVKNAVECTKLGSVAYLQKPFTAGKVKTVLSQIFTTISAEASINIPSEVLKAESLISHDKLKEAYDLLKHALSLDPCCGKTYELLGKIHELKGDYDTANIFFQTSKQFENKV